MQLIGLSGYARSGKDEAAKALGELGYQRVAFADKLRAFLYALNCPVQPFDGHFPTLTVQEVVDRYGWDGYKSTPYGDHLRVLLQRLGTEAGRGVLWDSIWIDAAFHDLDLDGKYVVTDCRFPNEAAAVRDRGGYMVRIERTGVGPANSHPSETSLDDYNFDHWIANDYSLGEFHDAVKWITEEYYEGRL
jgi:hypothetical protein